MSRDVEVPFCYDWSQVTAEEIATNVRAVRERIEAAAERAGRDPQSVTLVAVSKTKPAWMVEAAAEAGATVFGENYVQEALAKQGEVKRPVSWHLIGALQTNKAKQVVGRFALLHAVDSEKLIRELDKRAAAAGVEAVDVLLEVNLAGEASKAGVPPEGVKTLLEAAKGSRVRVRGLTGMPPQAGGEANRSHFKRLASMARELGLAELSMGTTDDFEVAIEEGSTLVRVGTAIFGAREPKR